MTQIRTRIDRARAVDVPFAKQAGNPETDVQRAIERVLGFAAPKTAEYLVGASDATLTAERVVTDTATIAWDLATASQAKANVVDASITYAKIQNVAGLSVVGRAANSSGVSAAITAGSDDQVLRRSGTSIAFGALNLASSDAVSGDLPFANIAQIAGLSVLGVTGAGTADVAAITAASDFQVLRRSGSAVSFGAVDLSQANAITGDLPFSALTQGSARSVLGVTGNATADFASIQGTADQVLVINTAGTALTFATVATGGITNNAVSFAKFQQITSDRLVGRDTASTGNVEEISVGGGIEFTGGPGIRDFRGVNAQTGTTYTYLDGDRAKLVTHTNGSSIAGTLPQAGAASSFAAGWFIDVENRGVGTLTITPTTSTIDGAANLALTQHQGARVFSDGTNYFTQRGVGGSSATGNMTRRTITGADTIVSGDKGNVVEATSGTFTLAFTAAATLANGFWTVITNSGTGDVTLDPNSSEQIDGLASWILYPGGSILVTCSGSAFESQLLAPMRKQFDSSGSFTKPGVGTEAMLEGWGGGASGGRGLNATRGAGGGGGGAHAAVIKPLSALGTTETVTIGAGGTAQTVADTSGNPGGTTSVGSLLSVFGGGAGGAGAVAFGGGGGGGIQGTGSVGGADGGNGGAPNPATFGTGGNATVGAAGIGNAFGGGGGGDGLAAGVGGASTYGGGGGGGGRAAAGQAGNAGGSSYFGGGGGGGSSIDTGGGAGGTSTHGGNGGAGTIDTNVGVSGTAPGGGGGGSENANSGAGADGRVIITVS